MKLRYQAPETRPLAGARGSVCAHLPSRDRQGTVFAVLALLPILLLSGCKKSGPERVAAAPKEAPAVRVSVLRVEPRSFTASVAVTGTLVSRSRVEIKAETTGRVVKFPREEGDRVKAGEAVAWVDETNYRIMLAQAQSAVKVAEAALERARVLEAHSRSELERADNLVKSGGITDRDLKAARVAAADARAQVELAGAQRDQARTGVDAARKRLEDTVIHAPVAGEISRKYVNEGAYVEPPTAVFALVDNSRLELESQVTTADLAPIRSGQRVEFAVNSFPRKAFEGRVIEVNPAVDADSRSARVRIAVDNRGGALKAGMFAEGRILTGAAEQAILVPLAAVYRDDRAAKDSYVFVVENGKATRRAVRVGHEQDGFLEIDSGLSPGDLLIAQQSIEIADGVRVQPSGNGAAQGR